MLWQGFIGGLGRLDSVNQSVERTVNSYLQPGPPPFSGALYQRPGLRLYVTGLDGPPRAEFAQDGRAWVVAGDQVYELANNGDGTGTATSIGTVMNDEQPASMSCNGHGGHQLIILSGGFGYIFDLNTGTFAQITAPSFPQNAVAVDFMDGYFIVLQAGTAKFYLSALYNGLVWDGTMVGQVNASSDNLAMLRVIKRNLFLIGTGRTEVWYNSGATFPLQPIDGALIEGGTNAPWSVGEYEDGLILLKADERGTATVVRTDGYNFRKVSTAAVDRLLRTVQTIEEARGYVYQEDGHTFYLLTFPTTGPTLRYDLTTDLWFEDGVWDTGAEVFRAARPTVHMFAFGKHLVGDRVDGVLYDQSIAYSTDTTTAGEQLIRRLRIVPHLNAERQYVFYNQFELEYETGLGTAQGSATPPKMTLRLSRDGGHTWGQPRHSTSVGLQGAYNQRVIWRQLGRAKTLTAEVTFTESTPYHLLAAYLRAEPGSGLQ